MFILEYLSLLFSYFGAFFNTALKSTDARGMKL